MPAAWIGLAVAIIGAYDQYTKGESAEDAAHNAELAQKEQAEYTKKMSEATAKGIEDAAAKEAAATRLAGQRAKKSQLAAIAKSGMKAETGTASVLQNELGILTKQSEQGILTGGKKRAELARLQGAAMSSEQYARASAIGEEGKSKFAAAQTGALFKVADASTGVLGGSGFLKQEKLKG